MHMSGGAYSPQTRGRRRRPRREPHGHSGRDGPSGMTEPGLPVTAAGEVSRGVSVGAGGARGAVTHWVSTWRAAADLPSFLRLSGLVILTGVDTRRLTRHLRSRGAMPVAMGSGTSEGR